MDNWMGHREDTIPEGWTARDGRLLRDMSWAELQIELGNNPALRRLLPKSLRDSRARAFRFHRNPPSGTEIL